MTDQQDNHIASGECGTCVWAIDQDGYLLIAPKEGGLGELTEFECREDRHGFEYTASPWCDHAEKIRSASFAGTVKAVTCEGMFSGCSMLESVDLSGLDTSEVDDMGEMFSDCSSLVSIDLTPFDTSGVREMDGTFFDCSSLTSLDLTGFDFTKIRSLREAFYYCENLQTIYASSSIKLSFGEEGCEAFYDCESLVGGNGTVYDSKHIDEDYARIDAPGSPGYFTAKE